MTIHITLWKGNKRSQEWTIEVEELAKKFWAWNAKERITDTWPLDRCIRAFITDAEKENGLQSVFNEDQYNEIYSTVRNAWPEDQQ
jgi:hypothetical protein